MTAGPQGHFGSGRAAAGGALKAPAQEFVPPWDPDAQQKRRRARAHTRKARARRSRGTYFLGGCFEESPGTGHWASPGPPRTGCHMTAFGVGEVKCEHKFTQPH